MASKQAQAKIDQNYRDKPEWPECRNCTFYSSVVVDVFTEKEMRCDLGGFKVKKLGTCDKHKPKGT